MTDKEYREQCIKLEEERNEILHDIATNLNNIDNTLYETLASAEVGEALHTLGIGAFGSSGTDFDPIVDSIDELTNTIKEIKK